MARYKRRRNSIKYLKKNPGALLAILFVFYVIAVEISKAIRNLITNVSNFDFDSTMFLIGVIFLIFIPYIYYNQKWDKVLKINNENTALINIKNNQHVNDMLKLHHNDFEKLVADYFSLLGYKSEVTQKTADGGKDVIMWDSKNNKILVECKRYTPGNKVDVKLIRQLKGTMAIEKVNKGYFVTTSSFTKSALAEAEKLDITTIDGDDLSINIRKLLRTVK
ncbi:MAG: hypothetical protein K0S34_76 [Bacillales bacterium]|jgi:HJR/Mrr/RecB family endonuclease|nr:hypothetical protein [Bacillales bacterium]